MSKRQWLKFAGLLAAVPAAASLVFAAEAITLTCPAGSGTVGAAYSSALTAGGGVPPYTISISAGGLPGGLTLNSSTGAISGIPSSPGTADFTAKVVDSLIPGAGGSPDSTSTSCSIVIAPSAPSPVITGLSPYFAVAGASPFTVTIDGTGFIPTSTVKWNGNPLVTTFHSSIQLTAQVSSALVNTPESATVTVTNGQLTSNGATFTVEEPWVQITDEYAVTFGQGTPVDSDLIFDWQTGFAFADYTELSKDGYPGGYLQVLQFDSSDPQSEGTWVVQNLPIQAPQLLGGSGLPFTLAAQAGGPVNNMNGAVFHTNFAAAPPRAAVAGGARPAMPFVPPVQRNQLRPQQFNLPPINSWIGGVQLPAPANPPATKDIQPIDPKMERTDSQGSLTDNNSIEQRVNECAPASVANSMKYLGVNDGPKKNGQPAPATDQQRVNGLDAQMFYSPVTGTSPLFTLIGKENYIAGANPSGRPLPITVHTQGRFCPNASIDPNCPSGENGDSGNSPTEPFITGALQKKKDVEVCFAWAAYPAMPGPPRKAATPAGAHCVFVTGYRFVFGFLVLDYTQDFNQGRTGGIGWEDGGHMSMRIGIVNNQLWIRDFFGHPAMVTNVITEEMN